MPFPTWIYPGPGCWGSVSLIIFLRGNYPRLEGRQWWRLSFLVTCGLTFKCPGPPIGLDSCSGLSSDWLAARQEPVGMQGEAPAPNPPETAGKEELIWAPLILGAALPAPSQIPLLGSQTKLWRGAAPKVWLQIDLAADPSLHLRHRGRRWG